MHPEAVELMRRLAPDHTITQIIERLYEAGFRPKFGSERFTPSTLYPTFKAYGITLACPEKPRGLGDKPRGDGRYSVPAVAKMLNVSRDTVYSWCDKGILDGIRKGGFKSAYWVKISPEEVEALKKP